MSRLSADSVGEHCANRDVPGQGRSSVPHDGGQMLNSRELLRTLQQLRHQRHAGTEASSGPDHLPGLVPIDGAAEIDGVILMSDLRQPSLFAVDAPDADGFARSILDQPALIPHDGTGDAPATNYRSAHPDDLDPMPARGLDGQYTVRHGWRSSEQALDAPLFDSGIPHSSERQDSHGVESGPLASQSSESRDSQAARESTSDGNGLTGRSAAPMPGIAESDTAPRGVRAAHPGSSFGDAGDAMTGTSYHDPAPSGVPPGWQAADTPGFGRIVRDSGDSSLSIRKHVSDRLMTGAALPGPRPALPGDPVGDTHATRAMDAHVPPSQFMAALLGDVVRFAEAPMSSERRDADPPDVRRDVLDPLLRMLDHPTTLT